MDRLLKGATTANCKADLLLGEGERWVSASLKSNPSALPKSFADADGTVGAPRIGITATGWPAAGIVRDPASGGVIVRVPVDSRYFTLSRLVLDEVRTAFVRHLSVPTTPLRQDITGVGKQLWHWRDRTVRQAVDVLGELAGPSAIPV